MRAAVVPIALLLACGGAAPRGAIAVAASDGRLEDLQSLLRAARSVDAPDGGLTALMWAARAGHVAVVRALVASGADVGARSPRGDTALMLAAGAGHLEMVEELLRGGADPRASNDAGATALSNAVAAGSAAIVDALQARDPDLRLQENFVGMASRWLARLQGKSDVLSHLAR